MDAASKRITDKLWRALCLRARRRTRRIAGPSEAITSKEPEYEVEVPDGRTLRLHLACNGLWRVLKPALPKP